MKFIVVEGPIGVGKTTLTHKLSATFGYDLLLEGANENPFLERFYHDQKQWALQTQLYFLLQRAEQLNALRQNDLFEPVRVADFLIHKDRLFAGLTLDDDEFSLYDKVYQHVISSIPCPDLVIYLQAPVSVLLARIRRRGIAYERDIESDYLETLNRAYTEFFHYYDDAPLLVVNASEIDFANNDRHFAALLEQIGRMDGLRQYFNPNPTLL